MMFDRHQALHLANQLRGLSTGLLKPTVTTTDTDTQVYIHCPPNNGPATIIFPGTASGRDVQTNLQASKSTWGKGRAHSGFVRAFRSVLPSILDDVERRRLIIAGHSLGGALAMLCADYLAPRVDCVYTFGQPRVFNGPAAREYDNAVGDRTFRLVNRYDPVPKIPWLLGTYRHAGIEVFLDDDGIHVDRPPITRLLQPYTDFRDSAPDEAKRWISVQAHAITSYIGRLS